MEAAHDIIVGSLTALIAVVVVIGFTFAFVLAPLLVGGGFVLVFLLYQLVRGHA